MTKEWVKMTNKIVATKELELARSHLDTAIAMLHGKNKIQLATIITRLDKIIQCCLEEETNSVDRWMWKARNGE